jgi:hypothetical protein
MKSNCKINMLQIGKSIIIHRADISKIWGKLNKSAKKLSRMQKSKYSDQ